MQWEPMLLTLGILISLMILILFSASSAVVRSTRKQLEDVKSKKLEASKTYSDIADAILYDAPIHPSFLKKSASVDRFENHKPKAYIWR